jgi:uncharacterized protein YqeY
VKRHLQRVSREVSRRKRLYCPAERRDCQTFDRAGRTGGSAAARALTVPRRPRGTSLASLPRSLKSMNLKSQIQTDMKGAMKAGDKDRLKVVRMLLAAIKQIEIDQRVELDDPGVLGVIEKMVKQRRDSVSQFEAGNRQDLATIELAEIAELERYLPEPLSESELDDLIDRAITDTGAATIRDMGKVMGKLKSAAQGRADMGAVGARVKARLAG